MASELRRLLGLFLKLGFTAFGGPAAHIAMMEDEVVARRGWMSRQRFLDLVGATNLIPGPNSTEMALHVGFDRAGWRGMLVAGAAFIVPAALTTGALGWLYVEYGTLPAAGPYLAGVQAAVLAIIASAVWRLGRKAVTSWRLLLLGAAAASSVLYGWSPILVLLATGALGTLWLGVRGLHASGRGAGAVLLVPALSTPTISAAVAPAAAGPVPLVALGLQFLKIGAVLYGSGYVLIAFLERSMVTELGWITREQLLDVVALGQLTPGPVLTTATVIGYLTAGVAGAVVATVAIFLPSFVFVSILNPLVPRLRESIWSAAFLDAVNVAAVGLMAAVVIELGRGTLGSWPARLILALSLIAILKFRIGTPWVVLAAAAAGALAGAFGS